MSERRLYWQAQGSPRRLTAHTAKHASYDMWIWMLAEYKRLRHLGLSKGDARFTVIGAAAVSVSAEP